MHSQNYTTAGPTDYGSACTLPHFCSGNIPQWKLRTPAEAASLSPMQHSVDAAISLHTAGTNVCTTTTQPADRACALPHFCRGLRAAPHLPKKRKPNHYNPEAFPVLPQLMHSACLPCLRAAHFCIDNSLGKDSESLTTPKSCPPAPP